MITPLLEARRWTRTGSSDGSGRGPGGAGAVEPDGLVVGEGAGPGAQQLAGVGVEEDQARVVDADRDPPAGEDLGGQDLPAAEPDGPAAGHDPVDLDRRAVGVGGGQRRWPGRSAAGGGQALEVGGG